MRLVHAAVGSLLLLGTVASVHAQQIGPLPDIQFGSTSIRLEPIATGLGAPLYGTHPPDGSNRLFVLEQKGLILVVQNGVLLPTPALDIQTLVSPPFNPANANDERGLLGLAFHPGFSDPYSPGFGKLYLYHSAAIPVGETVTFVAPNNAVQNYKNVVDEWQISAADPNVIDPASRREIVSFGKNAGNHNGGTVAFGPDGYLYLALGDGGNANDVGPSHIEPGGNAQNLTTPLGKMLRFDPVDPALTPGSPDAVSGNGQYRIPASNPFHGAGEVSEIYALGHRNPYRFSFDTATGDLIVADVGQNNIEEIDREVLGGNYGWAVKEGDFLFDRATGTIGARSPGAPAGLIDPIAGTLATLEYDHSDGISITGGFVYRGAGIPELQGKYVFGDLALRNAPPRVDGRMFYADLGTGEIFEFLMPQFATNRLPNGLTVHGFGQDPDGELYAMVTNTPSNGTGGIIYKLVRDNPVPTLVELFRANPTPEGIEVEWRVRDASAFRSLGLERAAAAAGPWSAVSAAPAVEGGRSRVLDRAAPVATEVWYRLAGLLANGSPVTFPAISAIAASPVASFALSAVSPNPTVGSASLSYAVPREARIRLSLVDVQGRQVALLSDGVRAPGRYAAALDARDLPGGLYFVRLEAPGVQQVQRITIVR